MGSKWRKLKLAFGLNLCVYSPRNHVADNDDSPPPSQRRSDAALLSPPGDWTSAPTTPSSNRLRLSKSLSRSSSKVSPFFPFPPFYQFLCFDYASFYVILFFHELIDYEFAAISWIIVVSSLVICLLANKC